MPCYFSQMVLLLGCNQQGLLCPLQKSLRVFSRNGWKVCQKLVKIISRCKIIDQILHGYAGTGKHGCAA